MADEKKDDKSSGNLALDALKAVVNSPLADEVRPTIREAGKTSSTIFMLANAALGRFRLFGVAQMLRVRNQEALLHAQADAQLQMEAAEIQRRLEERLRPLMVYSEIIPEEHKQLPTARAVNDIVEGYMLAGEEESEGELRDMYARLLASAMDDRQEGVHPSFARIIGELTPKEAALFKECASQALRFNLEDYLRGYMSGRQGITDAFRYSTTERNSLLIRFESLARQRLMEIKRVYNGSSYHPGYKTVVEVTRLGVSFYEAVCGPLSPETHEHIEYLRQSRQDEVPIEDPMMRAIRESAL